MPSKVAPKPSGVKGARVETVKVYSGSGLIAEVPMYLDRRAMVFRAVYGEDHLSDANGEALRKKIKELVLGTVSLEWVPVIYASIEEGQAHYGSPAVWHNRNEEGIHFTYKRLYITRTPGGVVMYCTWDVEAEARNGAGQLLQFPYEGTLPVKLADYYRNRLGYLLPYDEGRYREIGAMATRVASLRSEQRQALEQMAAPLPPTEEHA